ncbi:MAG: glycerol-3-phosphate dehydrogenase/oxidase [Candidatus Omnitrophica bacterium]|nr:glycerol-3-phosphate dehydrogenase/oxidase [Candidatus Omnitrophota bacterium]
MHRLELLARLRSERFDLLVIGGGIVGAGIARDAAMRGLKVALVEKGDFASGTSSKTSKLIHGGLRYLEHGHLRLVFESLRERHTLRTIAPQLVRPLSLTIPVYQGDARSRWKLAIGLALYDGLACRRNIQAHRMLSRREALRQEPKLASAQLLAAASYADCQMDDARLCLANVLQAVSFGAVCCNYVKCLGFLKNHGMLCGAVVEESLTGGQFEVKAEVVVNAAGPWSDLIRHLNDPRAAHRLAPTKGIHLVVPRLTAGALFVQARHDRWMIFLLPWGDYSLIGTTESTDVGPLDALHATSDEVDYLLAEVNRVLPHASLTPSDIVTTYAGARPLLAFAGASTSASREHRIEIDRSGLVSVMGGKYTTYRLIAQQALDRIVKSCHLRAERCLTDQVSLLEPVHPIVLNRWQEVTRRVPHELLARLLAGYGTGAFRILELLEFEPGLIQPVCPHHDVIQAELAYVIREELACTVSDLLLRRTTIAFSACQGLDLLSTVAELLQRYGHCSLEQVEEQLQGYRQALADSLACTMRRGVSVLAGSVNRHGGRLLP